MTESKKKVPIRFLLANIDMLESKMYFPSAIKVDLRPFDFVVKAKSFINKDNKSVIVIVDATILSEKKASKLGFVKVGYVFDLQNSEDLINKKSGKVILTAEFQKLIKIVAVSTTRGIVYSQFRGTFLHGAILPIIDAKGIKTIELLG